MAWRAFRKRIWRNGGGYLNKKLRVKCNLTSYFPSLFLTDTELCDAGLNSQRSKGYV